MGKTQRIFDTVPTVDSETGFILFQTMLMWLGTLIVDITHTRFSGFDGQSRYS
jgi:hypothetical protein